MFIILVIIVVIIFSVSVQAQHKKILSRQKDKTTNGDSTYIKDDKTGISRRSDNKPISDEEIPNLIELGHQKALERERQSKNPKFHRTAKEEELSFRFETNHGYDINMYIESFEKYYELACSENNLDKKIELLKKTVSKFEKAKKWFYQTKGGTIYFQDMHEYLIDRVKRDLDECIEKRDYIIPKILNVIKSSNGILQKDIYQHLPDISKGDIQRYIRELETKCQIEREKSGGSYLLTIKETQKGET